MIKPYLPPLPRSGQTGRPRKYGYRQIVNGIFYVLRTGCTWDMMPHVLPAWHTWHTCHPYFSRWRRDGT